MVPTFKLFLIIASYLTVVSANRQGHYTSLSDAFPQLDNLQAYSDSPFLLNGGQNFTHCCLLAVNASLLYEHGFILENRPYYINTDINMLINATENEQFPCTATYDGNAAGAPVVAVPYPWLASKCPGWEISTFSNTLSWIQPLGSFLLPAIIFCLTIPRRYKIKVPDELFARDILEGVSWLLVPFAIAAALVFVTIDILLWLSICFAFAAPMIHSAILEAFLDYQVLKLLETSVKYGPMAVHMSAHLLYVVLVGNLDPGDKRHSQSPWHHVQKLVDCLNPNGRMQPEDNAMRDRFKQTKIRLGAILECQYSFGTRVGGPVVFFLGGFIFAVVSALSALGDNNTSNALAFGLWYMIIPHLSIISGLLLAANNPNTFAGIVSDTIAEYDESENYHAFEPTYQGAFKAPSLWSRGVNKYTWLKGVHQKYCTKLLETLIKFSFSTWFSVTAVSLFLIIAPFILAFLVAFYTPQIGISCRSFTFLIHFSTQLTQSVLWFWAHANVIVDAHAGSWLSEHGFYDPTPLTNLYNTGEHSIWSHLRGDPFKFLFTLTWYVLAVLSGTVAILCVIGGTTLQLMGVYNADICKITTSYWFSATRAASAPPIVISQNTSQQIQEAGNWWVNCGIVGATFMGVVAFVGWWYQRRLRNRFRWLVANIFKLEEQGDNCVIVDESAST